jgi:hypothetical protein
MNLLLLIYGKNYIYLIKLLSFLRKSVICFNGFKLKIFISVPILHFGHEAFYSIEHFLIQSIQKIYPH